MSFKQSIVGNTLWKSSGTELEIEVGTTSSDMKRCSKAVLQRSR